MRKLVQTDQKGDTQAHLYDMANRLEERQYRTYAQSGTIGTDGIPTGSIASDIEGNAQQDFDAFEYDLASRTTKAKKGRYINEVAYTYDDGGRMVDETITVNTTAGAGKSYSMLHDFDTDSRMTRCTYPDGSKKTSFFTDRDEVDKTFYQGNLVADMAYDAGYRETSRTYGNSLVTSKSYNDDNTYSSITVAGKTGLSFDYTYDDNKNVLTETTGSPMTGYSWTSTYDAKDRLKTWARTNVVDSQSWDLSEVGDWKSLTDNGVTTARGHSAVHEIGNVGASNLTHDAKGNTTIDELGRVLNWDFENKLQSSDASSAGGAASIGFTYDAMGRRITKDGTLYAYCGQKVCAEYDVGALAANPERKFIYGNYIDEPIMLVDADGAGADVDEYYYHCNRQYSVSGLTDSTGAVVERYAYTPYGQTTILATNGTTVRTTSSYDNPYMYTGRRIDLEFSDDPETTMYYFRARYYSPTLGRFVGRDPLGYVDGMSLYAGYFAMYWGMDPWGTKIICDSCDMRKYFEQFEIDYVMSPEGGDGPFVFSLNSSTVAAGATNGMMLRKLILERMLSSKEEFSITGKEYFEEHRNLHEHIKTRMRIVENTKKVKFGFAREKKVLNLIRPANLRDDPRAYFSAVNNAGTEIFCGFATQLLFYSGIGKWSKEEEKTRNHNLVFIPGDWAYFENLNFSAETWEPGYEGENLIHVGINDGKEDLFWGHFTGNNIRTGTQWWTEVNSWQSIDGNQSSKPSLKNVVIYPKAGLD